MRSPLTTVQITLETLQEEEQDLPAERKQSMIAAALRQFVVTLPDPEPPERSR